MSAKVGISITTPKQELKAREFAAEHHLPFIENPNDGVARAMDYLLLFTDQGIGLHHTSDKKINPFYIDFLAAKLQYRAKQAGQRSERLGRAMGMNASSHPLLVDATAGIGRDSFILAKLGYEVIMLEKSVILHAMLADALKRASLDPVAGQIVARMRLIWTDAIEWLQSKVEKPMVVYLDPMFPERKKSASVKKEMATLQKLLGKDENVSEAKLLQAALTCAIKRVVVKRPQLAPNIGDYAPNFALFGKTSRFDIYLINP